MNVEIKKMHIENDVVNNEPKIVFTDENGVEWVNSHQTLNNDGSGYSRLTEKSKCWYFKKK